MWLSSERGSETPERISILLAKVVNAWTLLRVYGSRSSEVESVVCSSIKLPG